ncbi:MAG: hypothetical protein EOS56_30785, partial [Mesorhizobium sp.]
AGILSPYSDGERGAVIGDFANLQRCGKNAGVAARPSLPVTIRGEMSGRTVRGSANVNDCSVRPETHDAVALMHLAQKSRRALG